ncbi:MAG: DUF1501 domain-containing protein [Candidatus Cloacimonetes bacterium]|nr:DUF1501 domain-containing protein [Candidatus Cloacimonadota bacterium]
MGLSPSFGLHPSLKSWMNIWDQGKLAVLHAVGYKNPIRSHFRSIEIVETASNSHEHLDHGWLTRILPQMAPAVLDGILIRTHEAGPLLGNPRLFAMNSTRDLKKASVLSSQESGSHNSALLHVLKVQKDLHSASRELLDKVKPLVDETFPKHKFGQDCKTAAEILGSGVAVPVLRLSHGGYDTHSNQLKRHQNLLLELSSGLTSLTQFLQDRDLWQNTAILTYSEFGRRVAQNQSKGTDHGAASVQFLMGGCVQGGFYGKAPNLTQLNQGDLDTSLQYTEIYQAIATDFWKIKQKFWTPNPELTEIFKG